MRVLDRLQGRLEAAQKVMSLGSEQKLSNFFAASKTHMGKAFQDEVDGLFAPSSTTGPKSVRLHWRAG